MLIENYYTNTSGYKKDITGKELIMNNIALIAPKYRDEIFGMQDTGPTHALGVARACYIIAREHYRMSIDDAKKVFLLGWLHDVGYEFASTVAEHAKVGADLAELIGFEYSEEIRHHGISQELFHSDVLDILYAADILVDAHGEFVTIEDRLDDISARHPKEDGVHESTEKLINHLKEKGLFT